MSQWTKESVVAELAAADLNVLGEKEIDHGVQLTLYEGTIVCLYKTGKVVVQGKKGEEKDLAQKLLGGAAPNKVPLAAKSAPQAAPVGGTDAKVFIVYGHDKASREALELLLLRLGLHPIILSNLVPDGKTIIEALIEHSEVPCAIVLLTPDDEGHVIGKDAMKRPRARQNVVLEMGMFLSKLGRNKVIILHKGDLELPSDINGLIYLAYTTDVREVKAKLAASLQKIGFNIDIAKLSAE
jgi:predicted nucleotide-binding protein